MIIQCPYCTTRYEIDAARLTDANPMFKCSRCRHIFPAPLPSKPSPTPPPASAVSSPPDEESLKLPFGEQGWKEADEAPPSEDLTVPDLEEEFTLGTEEPASPPSAAPVAAPRAARQSAVPKPPPVSLSNDADATENQDEEEEPTNEEEDEDAEVIAPRKARRETRRTNRRPRRPERSHMVPLFVFLAVVVAAYGLLARTLFANPALCDRLVGRLPFIGRLGDERLLVRKIALSDVTGGYQRIKDGKEVFVITGKALNTASVPLHGVQVAGKLYDNAGGPLGAKTISCGNVISAKVLKDLTPQEVSILQKLSPPRRFAIEPGEASTFVIVFMDPPGQAVEFSAQVVAAQRQA